MKHYSSYLSLRQLHALQWVHTPERHPAHACLQITVKQEVLDGVDSTEEVLAGVDSTRRTRYMHWAWCLKSQQVPVKPDACGHGCGQTVKAWQPQTLVENIALQVMIKSNSIGKVVIVTPEFEGKLECINYMCARIKLHTRNDSVNIRYSAKA
jgi:hypothetical protein